MTVGRGVCVAVGAGVGRGVVVGSSAATAIAVGVLTIAGEDGGGDAALRDERKMMMPLISNNNTVPASNMVACGVSPDGSRRKIRRRSRGSTNFFRYAGR